MKQLFIILFSVFLVKNSFAKMEFLKPVTWTLEKTKRGDTTIVTYKASMQKDWHIFSFNPGGDGLCIPTRFEKDEKIKLAFISEVKENSKIIKENMEGFGEVFYFEKEATFTQYFIGKKGQTVNTTVTFQSCNHSMCLPPDTHTFNIVLE